MLLLFWWLMIVTLVVAFGFFTQHFGRWQGPRYGTLSFYEFRCSSEVTMKKIGADAKTASACAWVPKNFHI